MLNNQMLVGIPIVILYAMFFIRTMKTEADFFYCGNCCLGLQNL